ncbi:uncharacterized protein LOC127873778 [Dreissena polymorpha]|uniref:BTB domain-containing protein n=1 Tax=Dreissena polymorpha TaxID=45954 RepID=A0A9D4KYF9_DREPO|nr:uncharacterized protein LOC127873778 [Dreissena polymorpha]XP_052273714.1 uncharacterized protein LOC127873778 [Dreissena polymorpha]KAH3848004.1 hypothetical protein DPMN_090340 [Dreissena polymorpha]
MLGEFLLSQLRALRENNILCDLDLIANDRTIVTMHQIVFTAMNKRHFELAVDNASTGVFDVQTKKRMILSCLDADELRLMVGFMYGQRISTPQRYKVLKTALEKVNMSYLLDPIGGSVHARLSKPTTTEAMYVEPQYDFLPASNIQFLVMREMDRGKIDPTYDNARTVEDSPKIMTASASNEGHNKYSEQPCIGENHSVEKSVKNKSGRTNECPEDNTMGTLDNTKLAKRTETFNRCARNEDLSSNTCEKPNVDNTKLDEGTQLKIRNSSEEFEQVEDTCLDEYCDSVSDEQLSINISHDHSGDKLISAKIAGNELSRNTCNNSYDNVDFVDNPSDEAKCLTSTENDVSKNQDQTGTSYQHLLHKSKHMLANNNGPSVVNKIAGTENHASDNGHKTDHWSPIIRVSEHKTSETVQEQVCVKIEPEHSKESKVGEENFGNVEDHEKDEGESMKNKDPSVDITCERDCNSAFTSNITSSAVYESPSVTILTIKEECNYISNERNSENRVKHLDANTVHSEPEVSVTNNAVNESNAEPNTKCAVHNRKPLFRKRSSHEAEIDDRRTIAMYYKECEDNAGILCKQQNKEVINSETSDRVPVSISVLSNSQSPMKVFPNQPIKQEKVDITHSSDAYGDKTTEVLPKCLEESFANQDCLPSTYFASSSLDITAKSTTAIPNPDIIVVPPSIVRKYISPFKKCKSDASCAKRRRFCIRNKNTDLSCIRNSTSVVANPNVVSPSVVANPNFVSPSVVANPNVISPCSSTKVVIKNVDDSYSVVKVNVYDDLKKQNITQGKSCELVLQRVGNITCNIPLPIKESQTKMPEKFGSVGSLETVTSSMHVDNKMSPTIVSTQYGNQSPVLSTLLSTGFEQFLPVAAAVLSTGKNQGLPVVRSTLSGGFGNSLSGVPTILSSGFGHQSQFVPTMLSTGFKKQLSDGPTFSSTGFAHQFVPSILPAVSGNQLPVAHATCTVLSTLSGKQLPELSTCLSTASTCSSQLSVVSSSMSIQNAIQKPVVSPVFTFSTCSKPLSVLCPMLPSTRSVSIPPSVSTLKSDMSGPQTTTVSVGIFTTSGNCLTTALNYNNTSCSKPQSSAQKYIKPHLSLGSLPFLNPATSAPVPVHITPITNKLHKNKSKKFSSPTSVDIVRYRVELLTHLMGQSQPKQQPSLLTVPSGMKPSVTGTSTDSEGAHFIGQGPFQTLVWKNKGREKSNSWMCDKIEPINSLSIGQHSDDEDEPLINVKKKLRVLSGSHVNSIKPSTKLDGMPCEDSSPSEENHMTSHLSILHGQTGVIVNVNIARDETQKGSEGLQNIHMKDNTGNEEEKKADETAKTKSSEQDMKVLAKLVPSKRTCVGTKRKLKEASVTSECDSNYSSSDTDEDGKNNVSNIAISKSDSSDTFRAVKTSHGENSICLDKDIPSLATKTPVLTEILKRRFFPSVSTTVDKIMHSETEQASLYSSVKSTSTSRKRSCNSETMSQNMYEIRDSFISDVIEIGDDSDSSPSAGAKDTQARPTYVDRKCLQEEIRVMNVSIAKLTMQGILDKKARELLKKFDKNNQTEDDRRGNHINMLYHNYTESEKKQFMDKLNKYLQELLIQRTQLKERLRISRLGQPRKQQRIMSKVKKISKQVNPIMQVPMKTAVSTISTETTMLPCIDNIDNCIPTVSSNLPGGLSYRKILPKPVLGVKIQNLNATLKIKGRKIQPKIEKQSVNESKKSSGLDPSL